MVGTAVDFLSLLETPSGLLILGVIFLYELYAPKLLDHNTALAPLVRDLPQDLSKVKEEQREIKTDVNNVQNNVEEVQERQKVQMQVQRAQARASENMDENRVDRYLLHNGVSVDEFLTEKEDGDDK